MFPPCRAYGAGELLPLSDYSNEGAPVTFKAWSCANAACGFTLTHRKGQLALKRAIPVEHEPPPEPATTGTKTWHAWRPPG